MSCCPIGDTQTVYNEIDQYLRIEGKQHTFMIFHGILNSLNSYVTKIGTLPIMESSAFNVDLLMLTI